MLYSIGGLFRSLCLSIVCLLRCVLWPNVQDRPIVFIEVEYECGFFPPMSTLIPKRGSNGGVEFDIRIPAKWRQIYQNFVLGGKNAKCWTLLICITCQLSFFSEQIRDVKQRQASNLSRVAAQWHGWELNPQRSSYKAELFPLSRGALSIIGYWEVMGGLSTGETSDP